MSNAESGPGTASGRAPGTLAKLERMTRALRHQEPDRVPVSDFYWGSFIRRWQQELDLPPDASPLTHYDLDWTVTHPNCDPWIRPFETIRETSDEVVVRTGFGAIVRKVFRFPMPEMVGWDIGTFEELEAAEFDDPADPRRYFEAGDNQLAGVGDGFQRNSPAWMDTVKSLRPDFVVFGSVIEVSECLTRLIGQMNTMLWMGMYPERMGRVIARIGAHYLEVTVAALEAANGLLDGFVIWGDFAYARGPLMSPSYWREHFRPWVEAIVDEIHARGLPVIYHGCGNVLPVFEDFIYMGVDAYNPLEVKAGMDAVELRREYGHRIAFCGNSDIRVWEVGDEAELRREVIRKLNAAKGGGYLFQSDHSVSSSVSGRTYDTVMRLVREYGRYPLDLGEFDEDIDTP
jgi:hypothetical protein